jgi:hypothetical protein
MRGWLETWYSRFSLDDLAERAQEEHVKKKHQDHLEKVLTKAKKKDNLRAARKLVEHQNGHLRLRSDPPLLVPLRSMPGGTDSDRLKEAINESCSKKRSTRASAVIAAVSATRLGIS